MKTIIQLPPIQIMKFSAVLAAISVLVVTTTALPINLDIKGLIPKTSFIRIPFLIKRDHSATVASTPNFDVVPKLARDTTGSEYHFSTNNDEQAPVQNAAVSRPVNKQDVPTNEVAVPTWKVKPSRAVIDVATTAESTRSFPTQKGDIRPITEEILAFCNGACSSWLCKIKMLLSTGKRW